MVCKTARACSQSKIWKKSKIRSRYDKKGMNRKEWKIIENCKIEIFEKKINGKKFEKKIWKNIWRKIWNKSSNRKVQIEYGKERNENFKKQYLEGGPQNLRQGYISVLRPLLAIFLPTT